MAAEPGRPGQPRPPTNAATPGAQEACPPADHVRQHDGPLRVTGVGVSVLYNPRQLNISWANGSDLTLRFDTIKSTVTVDLAPDEGLVLLRFGVRMGIQAARDGMTGVNVVLPFPETISAEVEGLAERLRSVAAVHGDARPGSISGHPAPDAQAAASRAAPVRIRAEPAYWGDDQSWVGLYPPKETQRLLAMPDEPAGPTEIPSGQLRQEFPE